MIRYQLKCHCKNEFESWFRSSADFDQQLEEKLLSCPLCGSTEISKALMAPNVSTSRLKKQTSENQSRDRELEELRVAARKIREHVVENSEYVGDKFANEARKIHYGDVPQRGIYGEADSDDLRELSEEGVEVMPLPSLPEDKN